MNDHVTEQRAPRSKALVLGGGGPVGRAWQMGIAAALLAEGVDLRDADLIVGTSAGAIVGARLALGLDPIAMNFAADATAASLPSPEAMAGLQALMAGMIRAANSPTPEVERTQIGRMALAAPTISEDASLARETFAAFKGQPWPPSFRATTVSTTTGRLKVWDALAGVPLERAVAASAALPAMWPPITIGDDRYMDGGVCSMLNADVASGCVSAVVVSCIDLAARPGAPDAYTTLNKRVLTEIDGLRREGATVEIVEPSAAFRELTGNGTRMLDVGLVPDAYVLGQRQAQARLEAIRCGWKKTD
jgi:NTE family protein